MGKNFDEYQKILSELNQSLTEEDIISNIEKIVKGFSVGLYREDLTKNPFYKSILLEIKEDVLEDLYKIRETIVNEMDSIHRSILEGEDSDKLIPLKVECQLLLVELDYKIEDIKSI